ncbi:MAG: glycosyltransferase [Polaromonas sp.]|nr:glycosyltransferase [Polaromonas sp.]
MIYIVAPYAPPERHGNTNLGASRKLEEIIKILHGLSLNLILINSGHSNNSQCLTASKCKIAGIELVEISLPGYKNSTAGKFIHLFKIPAVFKILSEFEQPDLVWFYNGYAFEMLFALMTPKANRTPLVLEFEDWHFSRNRGINPKPILDYFLWKLAAPLFAGSFSVNNFLQRKMAAVGPNANLLPGFVSDELVEIHQNTPPFKNPKIRVGYFGGLSVEKGADLVLELASLLPENFEIHVSGSGPLAEKFNAASYPNLFFHGRVSEHKLYQLIGYSDVIINPHTPIALENGGIFPFKVVEAVSSGRLLISTDVPRKNLESILLGVQFVNQSAEEFSKALMAAKNNYQKNKVNINRGALNAQKLFGKSKFLDAINSICRPQL